MIISVKEARKILGKEARGMTDEQIMEVITTMDLMAKDALRLAKERLAMKRDAEDLANVIYDIYKENEGGASDT